MAQFELQYKGARFVGEDSGRGRAIIFLHGFLENRKMWKELSASLPANFRRISLDLPGHGDSDNLSYLHTMEEMAEVVRALMRHLALRKAVLCGHSMGGYVALAFAEKYPDQLKGMILVNSNSRADSPEKQRNRDRAIALVKENPQSYIKTAIPLLFAEANRKALKKEIAWARREALKTSPQGIVAALEGMKIRADREPILAFAPYPILFLASEEDPIFPLEILEEQMQHERVKAIVLKGGHMSYLEEKESFFRGIKTFLALL